MNNSAWSDLNSKCDTPKLHDICHNLKCKCPKQITFTLRQFQLEGNGFKKTMEKLFEGAAKMWNIVIELGLKKASPNIPAGVAAKTKNPQSTQITSNVLKSVTDGKILSLTDMKGNGLRLKDM